jgi:hypothetical protein
MKKIAAQILLGLYMIAIARANTTLTISGTPPYACFQNANIYQTPLQASGNFSLTGVTGTGTFQSSVPASVPTFSFPPVAYLYNYTLNVSGLPSTTNHCLTLLVHFGTPAGCGYDEVFANPAAIQSAILAPFGDIDFTFAGGCLSPGQPSVSFTMSSAAAPKNGVVTVIDDFIDPVNGHLTETRINVTALVPDIPPDPPWWFLYQLPTVPYALFQGTLVDNNTDAPPVITNLSGNFNFVLQLLNAPTNGLAVSQVVTQNVQVVKGLFTMPLPFDPISMADGSARWLSIGVSSSINPGPPQFLTPMPITPAPQAYYAYSAGVVADLTPGQAVTSLNGLTDAVQLQPGAGILLGTNGNVLTVSAQPGFTSDRNLKTEFESVRPEDILAKVAALPIQSWRYTNEVAGIHHVGPMAQDFKAAFGLGTDGKMIYFVDESGVALAAIQGLNQKLADQLKARDAEIEQLKQDVAELKTLIAPPAGQAAGNLPNSNSTKQ